MANAWHGADPTGQADSSEYELGSVLMALVPVSLTAIRVWSPADAEVRVGRRGHVWTPAGVLLDTIVMPDGLSAGWSTHALDAPRALAAGDTVVISYETSGNYGAVPGALDGAAHVSVDLAVAFPASQACAILASGNGRFNTAPGNAPNASVGHTFYGIDAVYSLAGGSPPVITDVDVSADGLGVTATIIATDPDGLSGALYGAEWGDGDAEIGSASNVLTHTYAGPGTYALLASVTDSTGLSDHVAVLVQVAAPGLVSLSPVHPVQVGLFELLSGDATLTARATGGVWDQVPEDTRQPYVRIGDHLSIADNAHGAFGRQVTATVHVWTRARGNASGQAIAARIIELLDHQPAVLSTVVTGHRVVSVRCEFDQVVPDPNPEVRHHVLRFRIITDQE